MESYSRAYKTIYIPVDDQTVLPTPTKICSYGLPRIGNMNLSLTLAYLALIATANAVPNPSPGSLDVFKLDDQTTDTSAVLRAPAGLEVPTHMP